MGGIFTNIKDTYNIIAFGDSITKGIIYDKEKAKYSTLNNNFTNIVSTSIKGSVYNVGRFGSTITRGLSKMYNDVIKKSPDIVLIEFGGNDCDFKWDKIAENPDAYYEPNTKIEIFHKELCSMIATLKNNNILPVLMTLPPLDPQMYFQWISKMDSVSQKNILQWLGDKEKLFTWQASYSQMINEIAKETKTILIDVRSEFLKYEDYSKFLCIDGIHPNVKGHLLIANFLIKFINEKYTFLLQ